MSVYARARVRVFQAVIVMRTVLLLLNEGIKNRISVESVLPKVHIEDNGNLLFIRAIFFNPFLAVLQCA